jgi:ABC-2 type transport system permease protein
VSYEIGGALLTGNGYTPENGYPARSLADPLVWRAVGGTAVYLTALALLSLGVAALLRHTAAAISVIVALLFVPLIAASLLSGTASDRMLQISPMTAGLAVQRTVETAPDRVPITSGSGSA